MEATWLRSTPVIVGLWLLRVVFVLMLPGLWPKLGGIALLVVMPFARRFVIRQMCNRLEAKTEKENNDAESFHRVR